MDKSSCFTNIIFLLIMMSFGGESASIRSNTITQDELDEPLNSLCCPTYYRRDRRMGHTLHPRTPGRHHILRQKRILESLVYEQIIHEYQCASSEPIEDSRCVGSCHQIISEQPILAVNSRGHVSVQHIAIDSGCVFRES